MRYLLTGIGILVAILALIGALKILADWLKERRKWK